MVALSKVNSISSPFHDPPNTMIVGEMLIIESSLSNGENKKLGDRL